MTGFDKMLSQQIIIPLSHDNARTRAHKHARTQGTPALDVSNVLRHTARCVSRLGLATLKAEY